MSDYSIQRVRGNPGDDFPHNGARGWGLGSRVVSRTTGLVGHAVGAILDRGALDASKPECFSISVRVRAANGGRGHVSLPFEDLDPAPK
jgi:hypothetical protein